jgi:hypothetical protein
MKTLLAFFVITGAVATAAMAADGYHLLQKVEVAQGNGVSDYAAMDEVNRRVYFAH